MTDPLTIATAAFTVIRGIAELRKLRDAFDDQDNDQIQAVVAASLDQIREGIRVYAEQHPEDENAQELLTHIESLMALVQDDDNDPSLFDFAIDGLLGGIELYQEIRDPAFVSRAQGIADQMRENKRKFEPGAYIILLVLFVLPLSGCCFNRVTKEYVDTRSEPHVVVVEFPSGVEPEDVQIFNEEGKTQAAAFLPES